MYFYFTDSLNVESHIFYEGYIPLNVIEKYYFEYPSVFAS